MEMVDTDADLLFYFSNLPPVVQRENENTKKLSLSLLDGPVEVERKSRYRRPSRPRSIHVLLLPDSPQDYRPGRNF